MQTSLHINFNGQCETAFRFYEEKLGGKLEFLLRHGESPMADRVTPEWGGKVLHAALRVGGQVLMGCDAPPGCFQQPQGFSVSLSVKTPGEAERIYEVLSQEGSVRMPIQETFWAERFGMVVDRFGIPWMINCEKVPQNIPVTEEHLAVA